MQFVRVFYAVIEPRMKPRQVSCYVPVTEIVRVFRDNVDSYWLVSLRTPIEGAKFVVIEDGDFELLTGSSYRDMVLPDDEGKPRWQRGMSRKEWLVELARRQAEYVYDE